MILLLFLGGIVMTAVSEGKLFYHITALSNLQSIFEKGLFSRADVDKNHIEKKDIADTEIIARRKELGILEYVPFHFYEKTAFTGSVYDANPDIAFCTITILREYAANNNFMICTAHPLSYKPEAELYSDYEEGIKAIKWEKMDKRDFDDEESKNIGMAECLAPSPVSPYHFHSIYVATDKQKEYVEHLAEKLIGEIPFHVNVNTHFTQEGK